MVGQHLHQFICRVTDLPGFEHGFVDHWRNIGDGNMSKQPVFRERQVFDGDRVHIHFMAAVRFYMEDGRTILFLAKTGPIVIDVVEDGLLNSTGFTITCWKLECTWEFFRRQYAGIQMKGDIPGLFKNPTVVGSRVPIKYNVWAPRG